MTIDQILTKLNAAISRGNAAKEKADADLDYERAVDLRQRLDLLRGMGEPKGAGVMSDMQPTPDDLATAVRKALLRVAESVAKHTLQRSGWHAEDECFCVDLRAAEQEILAAVQREINGFPAQGVLESAIVRAREALEGTPNA